MTRTLPRLGAAAVLAVTLAVTTGCAAATPDPDTSESAAPAPSQTDAVAAPEESEEPVAVAEDPTCETIIPAATVADFESIGWTYEEQPFYAGEIELTEGIKCVWADFTVASDHLQIFAWSPITTEVAADAQAQLEGWGWIREEGADGVYITENPDTTIAVDSEGYGMTYLFGDGWVTHADTKQGLLLIEWPVS